MITCRFITSLTAIVLSFSAWSFDVPHAGQAPNIDGNPDDQAWKNAEWIEMKHLIIGTLPEPSDFSGRYKLVWTEEHLYVLAEITDDVLHDSRPDPLLDYWEDDTFEVFIDEDRSGGDHHASYNAFAYHIALDNQAVDLGPWLSEIDKKEGVQNIRTYPEHIHAVWNRGLDEPHTINWEVRITVFGDDYRDDVAAGEIAARPIKLTPGKIMGFMTAYCDADDPSGRQHFIGDVEIEPVDGNRNRGYIDASVFGEIRLVE